MNIPGFTAETSLYRVKLRFRSQNIDQLDNQAIIPQADFLCFALAVLVLAEPELVLAPWFDNAVFRHCS
jgi:hypothetical protein